MKLVFLHSLAVRLLPLRTPCLLIAGIGWGVVAWLLLDTDDPHSRAIRLLLVLTMWAMLLFSFVNLFKSPAPVVLPSLQWRERLVARLLYWLYCGMTFFFVGVVLVAVSLSVKLLLLD
ncbi:MAG: hypothetical protein V4603_06050 [Pseudomonadota bacterium]